MLLKCIKELKKIEVVLQNVQTLFSSYKSVMEVIYDTGYKAYCGPLND